MTATAIINRPTRIRTTRTRVRVITTNKAVMPNKDTIKAAMDTMMSRKFPAARRKVDRRTDLITEGITTLMPITHTTRTEVTTRARSTAGSTRTNIIMINTTTKERLLPASTRKAKATQSVEGIRRKTRRHLVISR